MDIIKEIFKVLNKVENKLYPPQYPQGNTSYSQCAEDILIHYIFSLRNVNYPSYLDIGANDPFYLNNTALFYKKGCTGVNIEANPELVPKFNKYRSNDINLNVGVGNREMDLNFFVLQDNTLSTFSEMEALELQKFGHKLEKVLKVKVITINKIIEQYCAGKFPDFLTLDVEGLDFDIIKTITFEKSFPKVICVEASEYSPIGAGKRRTDLIDYLISKGYYEYANTNLNAIMVKNEFWFP